jgi:hypothetical protein
VHKHSILLMKLMKIFEFKSTISKVVFSAAFRERHHPGHQVQALQASQQGERTAPDERELGPAH